MRVFSVSLDPWNIFTASFGGVPKPCTAFVTLLDMMVYFAFMFNVGGARKKHKVAAPSTDGPEAFLRVLRVQENTVEQMILHLPLLWIAAYAMDDSFAASLGAVWAFSRILYARGYYDKAKRRTKGFVIGMLVNMVLLAGAMIGTMASF
jgi:glutathione S-transferase